MSRRLFKLQKGREVAGGEVVENLVSMDESAECNALGNWKPVKLGK